MVQHSRLKRLKSVVMSQWVQFCLNTSLHGWKYTALPKTSKFERYGWFAICLSSLGVSILLLCLAWLRFESNPTITVIESTQHSIYKFEFPAVTVCSFNKISKTALYRAASDLKSTNSTNIESIINTLKLLFHLVDHDSYRASRQEYEALHRLLQSNGKTEGEVFESISPTCSQMIKKCMWKGEDKRCDVLFEKIKTSEGYCCSFNYFGLKRNVSNSQISKRFPKSPRKTTSCGYQSGLEILIDNDPNNYFATTVPSIGISLRIHYPYDTPDWAGPNVLCEVNTSNFIGINPEIITSTSNMRSRSIAERNCLFSTESKLEHFAEYTFHNCMIECKIALILELCACVPFYAYNNTTNMCTLKDVPCITENEHLLYNETFMDQKKMEKGGKCNCLTSCERASYVPEASKGALDSSYCTNQFNIYSGVNLVNRTVVRVFFNDLLATRHRRDVLFTWHTLMGYYGGILGLFTGFSFVSVVEIVYFCVIRCLNIKKKEKHKVKFGPNKLTINLEMFLQK